MGLPKAARTPAAPKRPPSPPGPLRARLERAFALARGGFGVFFCICVLTRVPPFLLRFFYILAFPDAADDPGPLNLTAAVAVLAYEAVAWILGALALLSALAAADAGRPLSLTGAFRAGAGRLKAGLKTFGLAALFCGVGLAALLIPGLILLYQFSFAPFAVAVEGLDGKAALDSSRALVRAHPQRTLANLAVLGAVGLAAVVAATVPLGLFLGFLYGVFDLSEDAAAVVLLFDLARRTVFQIVPVCVAAYWWAVYAEFSKKPEPPKDAGDPELIAL